MIVDEEIYLEHFGVKGMRWGTRKQGSTNLSDIGSFLKRHKKSVSIGVAGTTAIGAAFMAKNIRHKQKVAEISKISDRIRSIERELNFSRNLNSPFRSGLKNDLHNLRVNQIRVANGEKYVKAMKAIPLGPIGSTSVARLRGAIPL